MTILDRYIGKQVIAAILLVTFAILMVDVFFYLVNELRLVGKGDYTLSAALLYTLFTIPRKINTLFPWAALLGALIALGNMGKYSELVAIRVAAVSVTRIAWSALKAGILLTIIMFIFGEVVAPYAEQFAKKYRTSALSRGLAIQTNSGTWVRHNNEFIHVGEIQGASKLQRITRYNFDQNQQLQEVEYASSADKEKDDWLLHDVKGTKFQADNIAIETTEEKHIAELLDTEILHASSVKHLECLTLPNLWRVIKSRVANELNATEYQRAFWVKIIQPFAALVMVFLAVPFAFGPLRSASMGLKILVGVLVGFSFYTLNSIFGPLTAVTGLSPMLAAMIPSTMFFLLGFWMVQKVR